MTTTTLISDPSPRPAILRQTLAILHDAYREMNSKRMFWIVLFLSGVAMAAFAILSVTPDGLLDFAGHTLSSPYIPARSQYKFLFSYIIIDWWLTWGMLILAIISTAGIFPDFLSGGSIDLFIAKPISRLRLFLTKYLTAMLFVLLQVSIFSIIAYFVVGYRGKTWEPGLFLSIPIVLALFSYLYAIAVLLGVLTRSTIATLLLTILFWGLIGGMHFGEVRLQAMLNLKERRIEKIDKRLAMLEQAPATRPTTGGALGSVGDMFGVRPASLLDAAERNRLIESRKTAAEDAQFFRRWHRFAFPVHLILPKTAETSDLLVSKLIKSDEFLEMMDGQRNDVSDEFKNQVSDNDLWFLGQEIDQVRRARSIWRTIGSSLLFEAIVLGLAAWMFCRRDF